MIISMATSGVFLPVAAAGDVSVSVDAAISGTVSAAEPALCGTVSEGCETSDSGGGGGTPATPRPLILGTSPTNIIDAAAVAALLDRQDTTTTDGTFDAVLSPTNPPVGRYLVAVYPDEFAGAAPANLEVGDLGGGDARETVSGLVLTIGVEVLACTVVVSDFTIEAPGGIAFRRVA